MVLIAIYMLIGIPIASWSLVSDYPSVNYSGAADTMAAVLALASIWPVRAAIALTGGFVR